MEERQMHPLIWLAIGVVVAGAILSAPMADETYVETYYTAQPYTYDVHFIRDEQVRTGFLWLKKVTQTQYEVTNTDTQQGKFTLNFIFDNGSETQSKTETVTILRGEHKTVTMNSPLSGNSSAKLYVIPPNKEVAQQRTVHKKVNGWVYLWRLMPFVK